MPQWISIKGHVATRSLCGTDPGYSKMLLVDGTRLQGYKLIRCLQVKLICSQPHRHLIGWFGVVYRFASPACNPVALRHLWTDVTRTFNLCSIFLIRLEDIAILHCGWRLYSAETTQSAGERRTVGLNHAFLPDRSFLDVPLRNILSMTIGGHVSHVSVRWF
jgi:hypothetical protein